MTRLLQRFMHPIAYHHRTSKCSSCLANNAVLLSKSDRLSPVDESSSEKTIDRDEVLNMLRHFRDRRPYFNYIYLRHATYFSWKMDLQREFVDVSDEWFRQARPRIFDRERYVKATSVLCNLGKLNRLTGGYLMERLGWSPIKYLMRRMAEIGFEQYHAEDVVSAAGGLQYLITIRSAVGTKREQNRQLSPEFLDGLERYLKIKRSTDPDWEFLIRMTAPFLLFNLAYIYRDRPPAMDILSPLCRLTKLGLDRVVENETALGHRNVEIFTCIARAFLHGWNLNPDSITEKFWSSWYRVCGVVFRESERDDRIRKEISIRFLREMISVAERFDRFRYFQPLIDSWQRCVKDVCGRITELTAEPGLESIEAQLANFTYVVGSFAKVCINARWNLDDCRRLFENLLPRLEAALISRPVANLDGMSNCRWLTGIRDAKRELKLTYEPSQKYYNFLRDWCISVQSLKKPPVDTSKGAALILHLLLELNLRDAPPPSTLRQLSNVFCFGLDSLDDGAALQLSYFSANAARFRIALDEEQRKKYFAKVNSALIDSWPNKADNNWILFLDGILRLSISNKMYEDFRSIEKIYARRLGESADHFTPDHASKVAKKLEIMNRQYGFEFDVSLIKKLAGNCYPYTRRL